MDAQKYVTGLTRLPSHELRHQVPPAANQRTAAEVLYPAAQEHYELLSRVFSWLMQRIQDNPQVR